MNGSVRQVYEENRSSFALVTATSGKSDTVGKGSTVYFADGLTGTIESGRYPNYTVRLEGYALTKAKEWSTVKDESAAQVARYDRQVGQAKALDSWVESARKSVAPESKPAPSSESSIVGASAFIRDHWKALASAGALVVVGGYLLVGDDG